MIIALLGNPDCGKSTFFNRICSDKRKVGSFPGISVDIGTGRFRYKGEEHTLVDLPGTYSLSAVSAEEEVAVKFILSGKCHRIINIVDASSIERGISLTKEIVSKFPSVPAVIGLSRYDRTKEKGIKIDCKALSDRIGIPVIPFSAGKREDKSYIKLLHTALDAENHQKPAILGDTGPLLKGIITYTSDKITKSQRIDRIILHRFLAVPIFFLIIAFIFILTFFVFSPPLERLINSGCDRLCTLMRHGLLETGIGDNLCGFIVDGIFAGFFGVIGFLPVIVILFLFLSVLTDCGYMARVAFIFDSPMRKVGLSGRSTVPVLFALGCTVPALLSTRIIPSKAERKRCLFAVPFISCPAKIPMYLIIVRAFFHERSFLTITFIYLLGTFVMLFCTFLQSRSKILRESEPFLLELTDYSLPSPISIVREALGKVYDFLRKSVTIVPLISALLYIVGHFDLSFKYTEDIGSSIMFALGNALSVLMRPLGLGEPIICTALLAGIGAKEAVAGVLSSLLKTASYGDILLSSDALTRLIDPAAASALLIFFALCPPCAAAFSAMRRESGSLKETLLSYASQLVAAWIFGYIGYMISTLILKIL